MEGGGRWTYLALSLFLHLALFLGLSWVPLGGRGEQGRPIQVRLVAWEPPKPGPPRPQEAGKPQGERAFPGRATREAVAIARPVPVAPSRPTRKRRDLPLPAGGSLSRSVLPGPPVPVPLQVSPGGKAVAVAQAGEGAGGAPLTDPRASGTQEISEVPSPSVLAGPASSQGKPERDPTGKETTAVAAGNRGDVGGTPSTGLRASGTQEVSQGPPPFAVPAGSAEAPLSLAEPRYRESERPVYPRLARLRGYEGTVLLEVEVGADGRVRELGVKESSRYKVLDEAALRAVRKWLFLPAMRGGTPVPSRVLVPIRFQLVEEREPSK